MTPRGKRHRVRWPRIILVSFVALVLVGVGTAYYVYRSAGTNLTAAAGNTGAFKGRINILLLGEGLIRNGSQDILNKPNLPDQTDVIMLISIDTQTDQASLLSVPRDSEINLPQAGGLNKINDANFVGGPQLAVKIVSKTVGVPINFYAETTILNFSQIINDIGGLTIDVPYAMNYGNSNTAAGRFLDIHLKPGVQHLNGQQVVEFVRFREEALGDIGRIQQEQYVVKLILRKVLQPSEITKLPQVITLLRKDITQTNLTTTQLIQLGLFGTHLHLNQIRYATLPGIPQTINGIDYWKLDTNLLPVLRDDILLSHLSEADRHRIHITVRAGTGSLAPAQSLATWLQGEGFSVAAVVWANHHNHVTNTVQDYTGDKYLAGRLALTLGPRADTTVQEIPYHDVPGVDMVITVGSTFHLNPKAPL